MSGPYRAVRRIAVTVVGVVVLLAGLVMLVLPGPGLLGTAAGLAILATEYHWARRHVSHVRRRAHHASQLACASRLRTAVSVAAGIALITAGVVILVAPGLLPFAGGPAGMGLVIGGACVVAGTLLAYHERRVALRGCAQAGPRSAHREATTPTRG